MAPDRTTGHGEKLTRAHDKAIAALLTAARLEDAARACGISKSTLCRWLQEPAFQEAFRLARRQVLEAAVSRLQAVAGAAVETLARNLTCRKAAIEVQAARAVLEHATRSVEFFELEDRVRALERMLGDEAGEGR